MTDDPAVQCEMVSLYMADALAEGETLKGYLEEFKQLDEKCFRSSQAAWSGLRE